MTNEEMQARLVELARERDEARARVAELEAEPSCVVKWNGGDLLLVWQGSGSMRLADLGLCRVEELARAKEETREACARAVEAAMPKERSWHDGEQAIGRYDGMDRASDIIRATPLDATPLADANAKLREALEDFRRWPVVLTFARAMVRKLDLHAPKKGGREGWMNDDPQQLLGRLHEEALELRAAVGILGNRRETLNEAADVANMAMMVADADGALDIDAALDATKEGP